MKNPQNIAITGASSGLGSGLARHYARPGVTLHLQGRDEKRLETIAHECSLLGASVFPAIVDVTDRTAMDEWLTRADTQTPIDLIIANAGISAGTGIHGETSDQVRLIFATNIDGMVNTVQPLMNNMTARKHGQIAIISSLAGIRGLPSCPAYSASKACVRYYGEGLRGMLAEHGVEVSVICPGYIKTPMTEVNDFPMPFLMTSEKAAAIIARGLAKNKSRIAFPRTLYWPLWWLACLSPAITDWFFAKLPKKSSAPKISHP